jgi:DNA repair photolyase
MSKKITGTYEWASVSVNCSIGCRNDCKYCYAKRLAVMQKRISSYSEWRNKNEICRDLKKENKKHKGTVMFPTVHDIHPGNIKVCLDTIGNLLNAENKVLIVSKPWMSCIQDICDSFEYYKHKILFRFTIGCLDNKILQLWEPGAPKFEERIACLAYASAKGFQTSVSMEPMLNSVTVIHDAKVMFPFVTDGLWIGKMNKIRDRVTRIPENEIARIEAGQTDTEIHRIYAALKYEPKIRWKESFKEILGLNLSQEAGLDK